MESKKRQKGDKNMWTLEDKIRFKDDLDNKQHVRLSLNSLKLTKRIKELKQKMRSWSL